MNPLFIKSNELINKNKFSLKELNDNPYFLLCKKCKSFPKIDLKNKEKIVIECNICKTSKEEKIIDIVNYSSEWITNEKTISNISQDLDNCLYYCQNCCKQFFGKYTNDHKNHNYFILYDGLLNLFTFENFLENNQKIQKDKYIYINEILIYLDSLKINDEELGNELKNIISKILQIFYQDLKNEQNLIFFAKTLFATFIVAENDKNQNNYKYYSILENINDLLKKENIDKFKLSIIPLKQKYEKLCDCLSPKERENLEIYINNIFNSAQTNLNDLDNKKKFYENNIQYSDSIKKYIFVEKEKNPDKYIDIDETVNDFDSITEDFNSINNNYLLSLLGKCYEKNGTQINVSKKKDTKLKGIELASIQSLFSFGSQKKYEFHFDFGDKLNNQVLNDPKMQQDFLNQYSKIIAEKLKIDRKRLIFTNIHRGTIGVHVSIIDSTKKEEEKLLNLKNDLNIKEVEVKPLLEELQISQDILDKRWNRHCKWGMNETRGGEDYIPPLNGWNGFGLKVLGKYDNGNNDWLDYRNRKGEYAIAYIGINNELNDKGSMIEELNKYSQDINNVVRNKLYMNDIDLNKKSFFFFWGNEKCGDGICVFQNPDIAENSAGYIDIYGYRIKIMLMCRVNPKKIRKPEKFPSCWILNPNEIRPYRILIKKIPISPLTGTLNDKLITCISPIDYIVNSIKSINTSLLGIEEEENKYKFIKSISYMEGKKVNQDIFSIRLYTSCYYRHINNYLRNKNEVKLFPEDILQSWIYCLQLALSRNVNVKEDTVVYRGVKVYFPEEIQVGSKFYFREFLSTSTKKKFSLGWIKNEGTLMDITIKNNGTNGHPNYCYYIEDITVSKKQYEVLISCHCYFQVTKREKKGKIEYVSLICEGFLI